MAQSPGDEIITYLAVQLNAAATLGLTSWATGKTLFNTVVPEQPDMAIGLLERPGFRPFMTMTGGGLAESKTDQPVFQLLVRGPQQDYTSAFTLAMACFKALEGVSETTLVAGGATWHLIEALQSPAHLGRDEKQRHQYSQNFRAIVENVWR